MNRPVVLFATKDIREFVARILNGPATERRVALVAFVGRAPTRIASQITGVEVVCWPEPGATSGDGVSDLLRAGATVRFAHGMHRKVYWSEFRGALVGSANLSWSALGSGANAEACVYFPDSAEVPIAELLQNLAWDRKDFEKRLAELDAAAEPRDRFGEPDTEAPTFTQWCASWKAHDAGDGPPPRRWKVSVWSDNKIAHSQRSIVTARDDFGMDKPADFTTAAEAQTYAVGDWVLQVRLGNHRLSRPSWLRVQRVFEVPRSETDSYDEGFPFHAIEFDRSDRQPAPFSLGDAGPILAALGRWAVLLGWTDFDRQTDLLSEPPEIVRAVLCPPRNEIESFPSFYKDFWPTFREIVQDVPTGSGWHRKPTDLHYNYDGARSTRWNNVYAHVGFTQVPGGRRLTVEWYEANRALPEWQDFLRHVRGVAPPAPLVVEHEPGKKFERRRAYLTEVMTLQAMCARREMLLQLAAEGYRAMVAQLS